MFDALGLANTSVSNGSIQVENNSGKTSPTIPERGAGRPKEFAAETAAITGESKRSINQHIARAEALGDDLERTVGTSLDKGMDKGMGMDKDKDKGMGMGMGMGRRCHGIALCGLQGAG